MFDEIDIPTDHTIFAGPLLEVPAIMGIPIVIQRLGTHSNNRADLDCRVATFLNVTYQDASRVAVTCWKLSGRPQGQEATECGIRRGGLDVYQ
jgi:hypothetical protein